MAPRQERLQGKHLLGAKLGQLIALLTVVAICLAQVWGWPRWLFLQSDIFWLVESGRYIIDHHQLPGQEIYSYTRAGGTWILYQWLFELIVALLYNLGGWLAVSLLGTLFLSGLCFVFIYRGLLRAGVNALVGLMVVSSAVLAMTPDVAAVRPQLLSFGLLVLTQQIVDRAWGRPGRPALAVLWWLCPLILVWVNLHLSFTIELVVVAVYAACALGHRLLGPPALVPDWRAYAGVLLACATVSLINPYGPGIYQFLLYSWQDQNITPELRPLAWQNSPLLFGYLLLALPAIAGSGQILSLPQKLLAWIFFLAGLSGARFSIYFVFWSMPLVALVLTGLCRPLLERRWLVARSEAVRQVVLGWPYSVLILAGAAATTLVQPTFFPDSIPLASAERLGKPGEKGNLFCGEHAGSYLIFRFRGRIPVFIDTRADVYGRAFYEQFRRAMLYGDAWQTLMDRFRVTRALVPNRYALARKLEQSGQWDLVYRDKTYTIFQRGGKRQARSPDSPPARPPTDSLP